MDYIGAMGPGQFINSRCSGNSGPFGAKQRIAESKGTKGHPSVSNVNLHLFHLGVVGLACLGAQAALFTFRPLTFLAPDSPTYLELGERLLQHPSFVNLFDSARTPGYPSFLALLGALGIHGDAIAFAQAILLVAAAFELYVLTYWLTRSRWAATVAGVIIGTNLFLLDYERTFMTEALATFAVATLALCFWRWLHSSSLSWAVAFTGVSLLAIFTRPSLLYLPILLLLFVFFECRRKWTSVLVVIGIVYMPVIGYTLINDRLYPHSGLSVSDNINLFGKILEYKMAGEGDATRFPALWQAAQNLAPDSTALWHMPRQLPSDLLGVNAGNAGDFSREIICQHPMEYAGASLLDLILNWLSMPYLVPSIQQVESPSPPPVAATLFDIAVRQGAIPNGIAVRVWFSISFIPYTLTLAVPLLLLALALIRKELNRKFVLFVAAATLALLGTLMMSALLEYIIDPRKRIPVEPLIVVLMVAGVAQILHALRVRREIKGNSALSRIVKE